MAFGVAICAEEFRCSYGTVFLDHLAADGAGFSGGQVAVVALLQVDAHFVGSFHLELVHCFTGFGNVDVVVALHTFASPFLF